MTTIFDLSRYSSLDAILTEEVSPQVTPDSVWADDKWYLAGSTPGLEDTQFTIHFDVDANRRTIDELKWLAALLFIGRYGQTRYKYSSAGVFSAGLRHVARFMKQNDYQSFRKLTSAAFDEFADSIHKTLVDPEEEGGTLGEDVGENLDELVAEDGLEPMPFSPDDSEEVGGRAKAYNRLRIWKLLWDYRDVMAQAGIKPVAYDAFAKESPTLMSKRLATKAAGEIPALPDEFAIPLLEGAIRTLGRPADDVIALQTLYLSKLQRMDREPPTSERTVIRKALEGFTFGTIKGEAGPWREPMVLADEGAGGGDQLADMLETVRTACLIVIMGFTGVRISEAVSPDVGYRVILNDVLPSCVEVATSKSGLSNHYMLHGLLSKAQERPTPESWLIGSRPKFAATEPATVRAVRVLELLYKPWRDFASEPLARTRLFVGFVRRGLPRSPASVIAVTSQRLRDDMKAFAADARLVDLTGLHEAAKSKPLLAPYARDPKIIRPHQWRKTFMRYAMRTDPKMTPAVSQHFKHYTVAMTERDYGPKDIQMLQEADSARARSTGNALRRIIEGKSRPVARMDKAIALAADQWRELAPDGASDDKAFTAVAIDQDLRIWYADHGRCLVALRPDQARCHQRAGTKGWRHARPNVTTRTPSLCAGCANFLLHEGSADFWRTRYVRHQRAYLQSRGEPGFEIVRRRAEQSAAFLRALGEEPPFINLGDA